MKTPNLRELAPGIFLVDDESTFMGVRAGHQMAVVRLGPQSGGGLWIHSPIAFSPDLWGQLDTLADPATPRHLIIPSRTHDLHIEEWLQHIPAETSFAPAAISRVHTDWQIGQTLTDELVAPWSGELVHKRILGAPRVNEVAFLHKPSKTLILVDSVFNLRGPQSFLGGLMMRLNQCASGISTSRLFRFAIKDKRAFQASFQAVLAWDFERVVVGHGEVIEGHEVAQLRTHLASFG